MPSITCTNLVIWVGVVDGDKGSRKLGIPSCDLQNDDATYREGYATYRDGYATHREGYVKGVSECDGMGHTSQRNNRHHSTHINRFREHMWQHSAMHMEFNDDHTAYSECYNHTIDSSLNRGVTALRCMVHLHSEVVCPRVPVCVGSGLVYW